MIIVAVKAHSHAVSTHFGMFPAAPGVPAWFHQLSSVFFHTPDNPLSVSLLPCPPPLVPRHRKKSPNPIGRVAAHNLGLLAKEVGAELVTKDLLELFTGETGVHRSQSLAPLKIWSCLCCWLIL